MAYNCGEATALLISMKELQKEYDVLTSLDDCLFELKFNSLVEFDKEETEILEKFEKMIELKCHQTRNEYARNAKNYIKLN